MINVLMVGGSTGRECAIAKRLALNKNIKLLTYQWMYNPYVEVLSHHYTIGDVRDVEKISYFAKKYKANYAFIGQGESLESGLVDKLEEIGIPCIGPRKKMAMLESDKDYCLSFVKEIDPSIVPIYKSFSVLDSNELEKFTSRLEPKIVVKKDGKINSCGVKIFDMNHDSYESLKFYCNDWISLGGRIILQEYLEGKEVSVITYTDGTNFVHSPLTKNYKSIFEEDKGPQTSGMGAVTFPVLPSFVNNQQFNYIKSVNEGVLKLIQDYTGQIYRGALFGEFMITYSGEVKLIEYNVRFGNPSFVNHLSLLRDDLSIFFMNIIKGNLNSQKNFWKSLYSLSSYIVPKGYPYSKESLGKSCNFSYIPSDLLYYANLNYDKNKNATLSFSRAAAICITGNSLKLMNKKMNTLLAQCQGDIYWRKDIGILL